MARIVPLPKPNDYKRALWKIKKLWNGGNTEIAPHAQRRMEERGIDITDIQNVIRYGRIIEHSKPMTYWRYTLLGKSVDGDTVKCVVEINASLTIVTVI